MQLIQSSKESAQLKNKRVKLLVLVCSIKDRLVVPQFIPYTCSLHLGVAQTWRGASIEIILGNLFLKMKAFLCSMVLECCYKDVFSPVSESPLKNCPVKRSFQKIYKFCVFHSPRTLQKTHRKQMIMKLKCEGL